MTNQGIHLETWIRKQCITTKSFTLMVGCSDPVICKVKKGIPIEPKIANRITELTGGEVIPKTQRKGRPTGYKQRKIDL